MNHKLVLREMRSSVAIVTLNRPEKRNALARALVTQLLDTVDELAVSAAVRSVVLTGSGSAFCAGMDLKEAAELEATAEGEHTTIASLHEFGDLLQRIHTLPKPVVAAVNGDAIAGGAGLMTACDYVVAAETARIGYPEVRRGMVAAIVMHDLVRQVGDRRARELLVAGNLISAQIACAWGLVNVVASAANCLEEAIRFAEGFSECAPHALATTKRLLDDATSRPADLRGPAAISAAVRCNEEAHEGIRAFVEKRPPAWARSKQEEKAE
jgi:methylglutaconyl-CoA hydratase